MILLVGILLVCIVLLRIYRRLNGQKESDKGAYGNN